MLRIATLGQLPESLEELRLVGCEYLEAREFHKLDASFAKLKRLDVTGTKIDESYLKKLKEVVEVRSGERRLFDN